MKNEKVMISLFCAPGVTSLVKFFFLLIMFADDIGLVLIQILS